MITVCSILCNRLPIDCNAGLAAVVRKTRSARRAGALVFAVLLSAALQVGCGATCDRIEQDRRQFLARKTKNEDTHIAVTIPFSLANRLIEPHVSKVKPIAMAIPGLGKLSSYFGDLTIAPTRVALKAGAADHIGFRLEFDVLRNEKRAFGMYLESEVRPEIDLDTGKLAIGFTADVLKKAVPGVTKDAKRNLGDLIYGQIPGAARFLIKRSMVDGVVESAVDRLIDRFYERTKDRVLPRLSKMSRMALSLPNVPLSGVSISSTDKSGGSLRLAMTTSLPVRKGVTEPKAANPSKQNITIRASGSVAAELANWAMAKGWLPKRYDSKGKPKKDGELRPGLDWVPGDERPMKIERLLPFMYGSPYG